MGFHTCALSGLVGQSIDTQIPAIVDQILPLDNAGNFLPQDSLAIFGAYAQSATALRCKINSPAYRQVALPYITPITLFTRPSNLPSWLDLIRSPIRVPAYAPLGALFTSGLAMGTEQATAILFLEQSRVPAPMGDTYSIRATGTTTLVPFTWTQVPLTFDQPVIQGRYSLVGAACYSLGGIAFRLTMDNFYYRPGGLMGNGNSFRTNLWQVNGYYGEWGQFQNTSMPRLEVFSSTADTAEELYLQIIKIA